MFAKKVELPPCRLVLVPANLWAVKILSENDRNCKKNTYCARNFKAINAFRMCKDAPEFEACKHSAKTYSMWITLSVWIRCKTWNVKNTLQNEMRVKSLQNNKRIITLQKINWRCFFFFFKGSIFSFTSLSLIFVLIVYVQSYFVAKRNFYKKAVMFLFFIFERVTGNSMFPFENFSKVCVRIRISHGSDFSPFSFF